MTAAPLPSSVIVIAPTVAVGVAAARPLRAVSAFMADTIAVDRLIKAVTVAMAAPIPARVNAPSAVTAPPPPGAPTATVKSP